MSAVSSSGRWPKRQPKYRRWTPFLPSALTENSWAWALLAMNSAPFSVHCCAAPALGVTIIGKAARRTEAARFMRYIFLDGHPRRDDWGLRFHGRVLPGSPAARER